MLPFAFPGWQQHGLPEWVQLHYQRLDTNDYRNILALAWNDCLYRYIVEQRWSMKTIRKNIKYFFRNIGNYEYIAVFDLDEILVPFNDITIPDMMDSLQRHKRADSFQFESYYFPKLEDQASKEV